MSKSSRFWWLQGLILVSAVVGCKSSSGCAGGNCGGMGSSGAPVATGTAYPKNTAIGMNSGAGSGSPTYPALTAGQTYTPQSTSSTTMYPSLGGSH